MTQRLNYSDICLVSTLINAGINIDTVRRIAGHADESTTLGSYCYDRRSPETIKAQLEHAPA